MTDDILERQARYKNARVSGYILDSRKIGKELRNLRTTCARLAVETVAKRLDSAVPYILRLERGEFDFLRSDCGVRYAYFLRGQCPKQFKEIAVETTKMLDLIENGA